MSDTNKIRDTFFIRDGKLCVDKDKFNKYAKIDLELLIKRDPAIHDIIKNNALDLKASIDREILNRLLE